jgi:hypothetical protein
MTLRNTRMRSREGERGERGRRVECSLTVVIFALLTDRSIDWHCRGTANSSSLTSPITRPINIMLGLRLFHRVSTDAIRNHQFQLMDLHS